MYITRRISFLILALGLMAFEVSADRIETVNESFDTDGAKRIEIEADFGAGTLEIKPADMAEVAKFDVEYDSRKIRYFADYSTRGERGLLEFKSKMRKSFNHGDIDNDWVVTLSNRYPTEMSLDIGACEAEIDLGGIPLTDLSLDIGAASGFIDFSKKNPERMEELNIEIGASSVELVNLGNANFEYMEFECGAASCKLDFRGDFEGQSEVSVEVGVGSAKIILPKDIEVRILTDSDSWFSSVDFHNDDLDEVRNGQFETENYRKSKDRMIIRLEVGMGSVDVYFK